MRVSQTKTPPRPSASLQVFPCPKGEGLCPQYLSADSMPTGENKERRSASCSGQKCSGHRTNACFSHFENYTALLNICNVAAQLKSSLFPTLNMKEAFVRATRIATQAPSNSNNAIATTRVAFCKSSSFSFSSARWPLASSSVCGPAPYSTVGTPAVE